MTNESKSRFADSYRRLKRGYAYLPAVAKVLAMMGSAVFNAIKWSGWVQKVDDGLTTPLGVALSIEQALAAMVDTSVTRARGMIRQSHHEDEVKFQNADENSAAPPPQPDDIEGMLANHFHSLSHNHLVPPTDIHQQHRRLSLSETKVYTNGHSQPTIHHENFGDHSPALTPYTNGISGSPANGMHELALSPSHYGFIEDLQGRLPENLYKDATLCYPGVDGLGVVDSVAYRILQFLSIMYMCNSATSGYLSTFSLVALIGRAPGMGFDGKCDEGQSESWKLILVNFMALYLAYCSIVSFNKYNLGRIQTYYGTLFIKSNEPGATRGEWRDISWKSYLMTFISVTTNTVGIAFTGKHTWDLLGDQALCHLGIPQIPEAVKLILVAQACVTNFSTNGIMTLCAVHNRNSGKFKRNIVVLLEEAPSFRKFHPFIQFFMFLYAVNIGLGTSVAVAQLPETLDTSLIDFSYNAGMILMGVVLGAIALYSQFSLSVEGYHTELFKTGEDNKIKALQNVKKLKSSTTLTLSLLDEHDNKEGVPIPRHDSYTFDVDSTTALDESNSQGLVAQMKESLRSRLGMFSTHRSIIPHRDNLDEVNDPSTLPSLISSSGYFA